jgi:serine/threonine-protein kinase
MEVIEGQTLSARLADRPLPLEEVLRIGFQLANAVAHAHDRGIVHRDLKAANVMIAPDGHVKVLDFGLAKRVSGPEVTEVTTVAPLTGPHTVLGTVSYMSPEQLRGQPVDAPGDVWALGVILYEMAAGSRPFDGRTGFELSSAILRDDPRPLPPRVPTPLRTVIGRCLEKELARRYQRANEVRAALEAVGAVPSSSASGRAPRTRRRWVVEAVALAAILGVAAGAAFWWKSRPRAADAANARIQSIAVLPLENLSGDSGQDYFAAGMHEALITDLARIGLQKVIAKPSADAF